METIAFLLIGNDILGVCTTSPINHAKWFIIWTKTYYPIEDSLELYAKGRKDIYTSQKAKEPLHGDRLSEPCCVLAELVSFSIHGCVSHNSIDAAQLNAKAAKSRNYTCLSKAVTAANHPWDSRKISTHWQSQ